MDNDKFNQSLLLPSRLIFNSKYPGITEAIQRGFNTYVGQKLAESTEFEVLYNHTENIRDKAKILLLLGAHTLLSKINLTPGKRNIADRIRADIDHFIKKLLPLEKK